MAMFSLFPKSTLLRDRMIYLTVKVTACQKSSHEQCETRLDVRVLWDTSSFRIVILYISESVSLSTSHRRDPTAKWWYVCSGSCQFLFNLSSTRLRVWQVNLDLAAPHPALLSSVGWTQLVWSLWVSVIFYLPKPICQIPYLTSTASITLAVMPEEFTDFDMQRRLIKDVKWPRSLSCPLSGARDLLVTWLTHLRKSVHHFITSIGHRIWIISRLLFSSRSCHGDMLMC